VTLIRAVDHDIAFGVYPDMREHGFKSDAWPELWPTILAADILVIGSPIWLGQISAVCSNIIQRLYGMSAMLNDKGQWIWMMKQAISKIGSYSNTQRMVRRYATEAYLRYRG